MAQNRTMQDAFDEQRQRADDAEEQLRGAGYVSDGKGGWIAPEGPQLEEGEADQTSERRSLSAGAERGEGGRKPQGDPYQDLDRRFHDDMSKGATREKAGANWVGNLMDSDDKRTYVTDPERQGYDVL